MGDWIKLICAAGGLVGLGVWMSSLHWSRAAKVVAWIVLGLIFIFLWDAVAANRMGIDRSQLMGVLAAIGVAVGGVLLLHKFGSDGTVAATIVGIGLLMIAWFLYPFFATTPPPVIQPTTSSASQMAAPTPVLLPEVKIIREIHEVKEVHQKTSQKKSRRDDSFKKFCNDLTPEGRIAAGCPEGF